MSHTQLPPWPELHHFSWKLAENRAEEIDQGTYSMMKVEWHTYDPYYIVEAQSIAR
jgi:hypothetical protein